MTNIIDVSNKVLLNEIDGTNSQRFAVTIKSLGCYNEVGKASVVAQMRWMTSYWAHVINSDSPMPLFVTNRFSKCKTFADWERVFRASVLPVVTKHNLPTELVKVPKIGVFT